MHLIFQRKAKRFGLRGVVWNVSWGVSSVSWYPSAVLALQSALSLKPSILSTSQIKNLKYCSQEVWLSIWGKITKVDGQGRGLYLFNKVTGLLHYSAKGFISCAAFQHLPFLFYHSALVTPLIYDQTILQYCASFDTVTALQCCWSSPSLFLGALCQHSSPAPTSGRAGSCFSLAADFCGPICKWVIFLCNILYLWITLLNICSVQTPNL